MKFSIKNTSPKAEREGNEIVRYSGVSEPFKRSTERQCSEIGVDGGGNSILEYVTGLDESKIEMYRWLTDDEKELIKKQIQEYKPKLMTAYGGEKVLAANNHFFWGRKNKEVNKLSVNNDTVDIFFDTDKPSHALLYLGIMAGAFMEVVAPNKEWAELHQLPHYLALETDDTDYDHDEELVKLEANGALSNLRKESPEGLLILAWCILSDTTSFGGMNKSTPQKEVLTNLARFIDGKLTSKKKRNAPKTFLKYVEKWNAPQTKAALYAEAYLKAGEYFALVNQREKKYVTTDGTVLGNTVTEAVDNLMKNKFSADLEKLRDAVETKWSE